MLWFHMLITYNFLGVQGFEGKESNIISIFTYVCSRGAAGCTTKEDIYADNLLQLNKEFNTIIEDLAIAEEKGYSSESSKDEFEEKFKQAKSVTAQMRRLAPSSKYKDVHKKVSQATTMLDKSFNKQLEAIKKKIQPNLKKLQTV